MASDWYARKLGGATQTPSTPPVRPSAPIPVRIPTSTDPRVQVAYNAAEDKVTTRPQHLRKQDICPECQSGNYFAASANTQKKCFDCGYPIIQAGSGIGSISNDGKPATPAKQVHGTNNFHPETIVGRL